MDLQERKKMGKFVHELTCVVQESASVMEKLKELLNQRVSSVLE